MSNKGKNEQSVAYSELAIRNNLSIVEYCRTSVAAVSGCTAGVLGLTVGFKSVEEKKSLEILLKDKPLDRGKLKQFCLRFCVPASYRNLIWKLLLGVVPVHVECHSFIMDQRKQEYNDLLRALNIMRVIDINTSKPQVFLAMWLLQTGNFTYDINLGNEKADIPKLIEYSYCLLEKEDSVLYKHLQKIGVLDNLPLVKWFDCCFAGILNETALGKIWDKLCGGSYKILVYVVVVLLTNLKHRLLKCNNLISFTQCIKNIPEETADVIANKSIDMWQQHGSPLTIYDKPKP
ncbi:hypothetical protein NQ314_008715 [Rhamnusium bicolor]|uniref:TBC1 domain family member 7 n=1 Tax=Rhamnusium bicolor TaxID=1586634 RepID=A0AAV8Y925_9CUCU|nr:hypothetical protein NQ314_008715 [Rhamnusium bicolor]